MQQPTTEQHQPVPMVVELFGHSKIAGFVSEHNIAGAPFIRVDVPETDDTPSFTRMFHPNAVYCFNPVDEETMLEMAKRIQTKPIEPFIIEKMVEKVRLRQLTQGGQYPDSMDGDEDDFDDIDTRNLRQW
jgi:hypothetical protein